jgi:mRNA-degrading endonuclease RelE of RelBE toxin-antitoxin system
MKYNIATLPQFEKDLKKLAKKFNSIKNDIEILGEQLAENPRMGFEIIKDCRRNHENLLKLPAIPAKPLRHLRSR